MTPVSRTDVATQPKEATLPHDATSSATRALATTSAESVKESARLQQAARDFETVFLRQMLSALEKTTKVGDKGPNIAGQQAYGSMLVEAVADAVAAAGGIGLGSVLADALGEKSAESMRGSPGTLITMAPTAHGSSASTSRSSSPPTGAANFGRNSPQGSSSFAVPETEIRTTSPQIMGQLADRRIR